MTTHQATFLTCHYDELRMDIAAISPSEVDGTTRVKLHIDLTYVATFLLNSYSWGREQKTEGDGIGRSRGSITKNVLTWKDVESLPLLGTIPSLSVRPLHHSQFMISITPSYHISKCDMNGKFISFLT